MVKKDSRRTPSPALQEAARRVLAAGDRPLRSSFLSRALHALSSMTEQLGERTLSQAAGAPSDYATLLCALEQPEVLAALRRDDPLAASRLRGARASLDLFEAEGGTLSAEAVAQLLGITRQAVDKRRRAGRLLGLELGRRGYAYPAWQLGLEGVLPGVAEVLAAFTVQSPWMRAAWFLTPNVSLNGTRPLDALRAGRFDAVREAARLYGEQGAA